MPDSVPQELVDMIIDDVGRGRGRVNRPPLKAEEGNVPGRGIVVYETLKNCALVARSWTHRSQMNLFKGVAYTVNQDEGIRDLPLPSMASLRFVKSLEIYMAPENPHRGPITSYLLSMFSVCSLESLQVDKGLFSLGARFALYTSFSALSGRLLDITFRFCLFEPEPLHDILSIQDTIANVTFLGCDQDHPDDPSRKDIEWAPIYHSEDRTFCVIGGDGNASEEFMVDLSGLSVNFGRLEVDFYEDGDWVDATQCLIDANAETLSFLRLNVVSDSFTELPEVPEALAPPSLSPCANLSELVLNMKGSYSCIVETSAAIFATLLRANCPNLFKINLEVEDVKSLFLAKNRPEYAESWKNLDSTLCKLAEKLMNRRRKKFVFVVEVSCTDDTIRRAKKWIPRFLEMFDQEGSLHVHDGEFDVCSGYEYDMKHKGACMSEDACKEYAYESESDEKTKKDGAAKEGEGSKENQEGAKVMERKEGEDGKEEDGGNEGEKEGEKEDGENA